VVSGVTGNTGSVVAQHLLDHGKKVRVIVRSEDKGKVWAEKGAEIALADLTDVQALSKALSGAEVAYLLNPPSYNTKDMFSDAKVIFESFKQAIEGSGLQRVVFFIFSRISTPGRHWKYQNYTYFRVNTFRFKDSHNFPQSVLVHGKLAAECQI